ncbi:MAG: quinone-dependent dihydroorotate dehydrogenase [Alphaproteobacteria bacterium]|nr:quinone-dependent dihydroorotate dehydrogenase [Alphaproteobacteria bacterium]
MDAYRAIGPLLRLLPPETAHGLSLWALGHGLAPTMTAGDAAADPFLASRVWGLEFPHPIGLAAGFDKDARALGALFGLGFAFVEAGTVTPLPQPGNPRPRMFRLAADEAVINRFGFNSEGLDAFAARLGAFRDTSPGKGIVGANLGRNRHSADAAADYAGGVSRCAALADYLVINVSSPNTPGLRDLQSGEHLQELLPRVAAARDAACSGGGAKTPLLLKLAPDLALQEREAIAGVVMESASGGSGIDGLIIGNTTLSRPQTLQSRHRHEAGGLSGRPLFDLSTEVLRDFHRLTEGRFPLIGVGGVSSGRDAYLKIRAGASLVQLYTAFAYHGPALIGRIRGDLSDLLRADGYSCVTEAVGVDAR